MTIPESSIVSVLNHILPQVHEYRAQPEIQQPPFVVGLTGLQGSGKSTWANALATALQRHGFTVINVSLDDFYLDHDSLVKLREENPDNPLLRTRGQPGTHDTALISEFFASLAGSDDIFVPAFDKSKFDGEGDRVPRTQWRRVSPPIDIVIFEGWCVGFQPLSIGELTSRWEAERRENLSNVLGDGGMSTSTLGTHQLSHLLQINDNLRQYCNTFMRPTNFHYLIHLDTDDLAHVYLWRIDQERHLRMSSGHGMSDDAVIRFVQGYMPSYNLFLDRLQREDFVVRDGHSCHLRLIMDKHRIVTEQRIGSSPGV